jgi:hypothetical protein
MFGIIAAKRALGTSQPDSSIRFASRCHVDVISALRQLFWRAAWAPIAVVILHAIIARTSLRQPLDFPIHYLGGASIAFFVFQALPCFVMLLGRPSPFGSYLFSFALACTSGSFWEFGELLSDAFQHTHSQQSLHETMLDLIADTTGAITALILLFLYRRFRRDSKQRDALSQ